MGRGTSAISLDVFRKLIPIGIILTSKLPCPNVLLPLCPAAGEKRSWAGRKLGVDLRAYLGKASWLLPWPLMWVESPCEMCALPACAQATFVLGGTG